MKQKTGILYNVVRQYSHVLFAGALLIVLSGLLLLPTIKAIRTVEIDPQKHVITSRVITPGSAVSIITTVPAGSISYVIVWVDEGDASHSLIKKDYKALHLSIFSDEGDIIRTSNNPKLITRADRKALLFSFPLLRTNVAQLRSFRITQNGDSSVTAFRPLLDQVKSGESVDVAFQLGQQKNWITLFIDKIYQEKLDSHDIAAYLGRGKEIVGGANPYACVLAPLGSCVGYPAHLPTMYWVSAGFVLMGYDDLVSLAHIWRPLVFGSWMSVGVVLLVYMVRRQQPALAVASFGYWLFNRWSVNVLFIAHTDFFGVLFLLLATILFEQSPIWAGLLLGVSLSIKQVASLAVPLFLIYAWRVLKIRSWKFAGIIVAILAVPFGVTLPFLVNNPQATLTALVYVVNRPAQVVQGFAPSIDTLLDVGDGTKSSLMLLLTAMVYVVIWRRAVSLPAGILMVFVIMIGFTSVLYNQYVVWLLPFIPLAVSFRRTR